MIIPRPVKEGDKIGIISTGNCISKKDVKDAVKIIEGWGLIPVIGKTIGLRHGCFAGKDEDRLQDFQLMLDDESITAIIQAAGGYGSVRIIDAVDFKKFKKSPKWIAGYSDTTYIHWHLQGNLNTCSIHSTMPIDIKQEGVIKKSWNSLKTALFGERIFHKIKSEKLNRPGEGEGILVGGNLSIICNLSGSNSDIDLDGKILFIEEVNQHHFQLDGYMMALIKTSRVQKLKGLIVGQLTRIKEDKPAFGMTAQEIILNSVKDFDFPVCFNYPAGHQGLHLALPLGKKIKLSVTRKEVTIEEKD
jgi:muramoyltetrapeptide carboxypeptidase